MVKPLTFKGDKPKKRKHRPADPYTTTPPTKRTSTATSPPPQSQTEDAENSAEDTSWVSADTASDLAGPVLLVLPSDPPTCIACDANGKVFASALENLVESDPATAEPHDVRQVWVATRVAGTEAISFKGHHGKYLSSDSHGILSSTASAIALPESFLVIPSPEIGGAFALQTSSAGDGITDDTFVCAREAPSAKTASGTTVDIRGDATALSFETTIRIRMQARFKPRIKLSKEVKAREKVSRKELEEAVGRRLDDDEVKRLRRSRREGNYHEELLDVKVKGKHDKFA
ncbi:FRG1-like family protein [Aspergillus campestris IBT 28561]|uniref:FRG1-like family protein n=1 Tax=Aspergillus campestris (strain IBT 28561) TaxID=1392248 RepID=A0A2I1D3F7_ASPC2|nr:FRG1-like family protein [Aspergillus campestris IBT 28561]PKY04396.1 FRG1-like family protein [Aspergillus campestris IBT 28561]